MTLVELVTKIAARLQTCIEISGSATVDELGAQGLELLSTIPGVCPEDTTVESLEEISKVLVEIGVAIGKKSPSPRVDIAAIELQSLAEQLPMCSPPVAPFVVGVFIVPNRLTVETNEVVQFEALEEWSDGINRPAPNPVWSTSNGAITQGGLYTAPAAEVTNVIVTALSSGFTAIEEFSVDEPIIVPPPPPPPPPPGGTYTPFIAEYWYDYTDQAQLVGKIGTDNQGHTRMQPVLPVEDFYDVVLNQSVPKRDGTMSNGSVLRYLGGPQLNSYPVIVEALNPGPAGNNINIKSMKATSLHQDKRKWIFTDGVITEVYDEVTRKNIVGALAGTEPGYTASQLVRITAPMNTGIIDLPGGPGTTAPNNQVNDHGNLSGGATGVKATKQFGDNAPGRTAAYSVGFGAFGGVRKHVWIRTFLRFSPNWGTFANAGGTGGPSHKMIFLLDTPVGRGIFVADNLRSWEYNAGGGHSTGKVIQSGTLLHHNVTSINQLYNTTGFPWPDLYNDDLNPDTFKMFKVPNQPAKVPYFGLGNGEWYEIIWQRKCSVPSDPQKILVTQGMRQFTVGGVKNPLPWRLATEFKLLDQGTWNPMVRYSQGINRNRQWDEAVYWDWAFFELVDGEVYPNPWGVAWAV